MVGRTGQRFHLLVNLLRSICGARAQAAPVGRAWDGDDAGMGVQDAVALAVVAGGLGGVAVMCSRDDRGEARVEPFPLVIRRAAREEVERRLAAGNRSVYSLREAAGVSVVPAPAEWPARVWTNLNRPEDVEAFLR